MSLCAPRCGPWPLTVSPVAPRPTSVPTPGLKHRRRAAGVAAGVVALRALPKPRDARRMLRWLEGLGAKGLEKISVQSGDKGLGVFALEDVSEGEVVCSIPGPAILSADGGTAGLALRLLLERDMGSGSVFEPYISVLPKEVPKSHPLMWPPDISVQQLLAGSVHGKAVAEDLLTEGTANLQQLMSEGFSEDICRWALVIVDTRAFTFQSGTPHERLALVPLLDLFNHRTDAQLWQCSFEPDGPVEDGAVLLAERPIRGKEEIFHLYNANSSAMLWMVYGFLEESENLFEAAGIEVDLRPPTSDGPELRAAKESAVKDYLDDLNEEIHILELPRDAEEGGEMMPLARLLASTSLEDLQCAVATNGRAKAEPSREDLVLELKARRLAIQWLRKALAASNLAAEAEATRSSAEVQQLWRSAKRLLEFERPVLQLELEASQRFVADGTAALASDNDFRAFVEAQWCREGGWMGAG